MKVVFILLLALSSLLSFSLQAAPRHHDKPKLDAGLAAFRYQGGDGSNSGVVLEGAVIYEFSRNLSAGVGFHGDFESETETADNQTIEFEDSFGPMALVHWDSDFNWGLGAKYIQIEYETTDGVEYDGDQVTLFVSFKF